MSVLGGDMLPQATSSAAAPVAEAIDNSAGEDEEEESGNEEEEAGGAVAVSLANSLSNAADGGSAEANKNAGSLIASGDIVVIDNQE